MDACLYLLLDIMWCVMSLITPMPTDEQPTTPGVPPRSLTYDERLSAARITEIARRSRDNAIEERTMLLAVWSKQKSAGTFHLRPVSSRSASTRSQMNWVVCGHTKEGPMQWRISDYEAEAYFSHLRRKVCDQPEVRREDKLERLSRLIGL